MADPLPSRVLRVLIFTDVNIDVTATLVAETLRLVGARSTLQVCGIVTSRPEKFRSSPMLRALRAGRRALVAAANRDVPAGSVSRPMLDLPRLQRDTDIPILTPPRGDINGAAFLARLDHVRPDVALSYFCLSIFRAELLQRFEQCVNFHDALLPQRKGLLATSFSLYHGDAATGFTFHRMTDDIDAGPILVQGSIPMRDGEAIAAVRRRQLAAAKAALPDVLELVAANHPGRPQSGPGDYHSRAEARSMTHVEQPETLTGDELRRRLRAFGFVHLTIGGSTYPVTRLRPSRRGRPLAFSTADGAVLAPDRLHGLPVGLFRLSQPLYRL